MVQRCAWVNQDPRYIDYHDHEWGVPERDGRALFEKLCLDGQQAGLSWFTILCKIPAYRKAFAGFEPARLVTFTPQDVDRLMQNAGIVRNRRKIESIITNARAYSAMEEEGIDFSRWLWAFVGGNPVINRWPDAGSVPVTTPESDAMARALKKRGFAFVGSTSCYAFMQATGMVNDHLLSCHCHPDSVSC
ncbi:DNA-3-methyladenine glycosylase I [Oceanimonas marisflavi]|uniref:DNA-3-methyladenine glycosylase I n=1 Tax=Oceanimonas marisflavi TaxID=2059724 RepID=UPI000D2FDB67|nr:DNA-3-methyladenine glycosylase I [Oceanimonas marisflavi]